MAPTLQVHQTMCVTPFVVEDTQVIKFRLSPLPLKHTAVKTSFFMEHISWQHSEKKKKSNYLWLFLTLCFSFPRDRMEPRRALGRDGLSQEGNPWCVQTMDGGAGVIQWEASRKQHTSDTHATLAIRHPNWVSQGCEHPLNRNTSDFMMKLMKYNGKINK